MNCYLRPFRYMSTSAGTHAADFLDAVKHSEGFQRAAVVLVTADNGPDYSPESAIVQHMWYKLWRKCQWAGLLIATHAPGHSSKNWWVEGQWSQVTRATRGQ
eukprot:1905711-Karenia_brevis.AAC.1